MTKKIILALAALAGAVSYAQQTTTAPASVVTGPGLLGQRYVEAGFGFNDVKHSSVDAFATGVSINNPINNNIDINVGYSYQWVEGNSDVNGHALDLSGTYYITEGNLKPFGTVSVGYVWPDLGDELTWGAGAGFEYIFNSKLSGRVFGGYDDSFRNHSSSIDGSFHGTAGLNYWVNNQWGVSGDLTWFERGNVGYALSAVFKF